MNERVFYWAVQGWSIVAVALIIGLGILTNEHLFFGVCAVFIMVTMFLRHKTYESGNKEDGDVHHF